MKTYGALAAGLLALAVAGCSSTSDSPSAAAPASSAAAPSAAAPSAAATSDPATGSSAAAGSAGSAGSAGDAGSAGSAGDDSGECSGAVAKTKSALSGLAVSEVTLPAGCSMVFIRTPNNDKALGLQLCEKAAATVFPLGLSGVDVETDQGDSLALGAPSQPCQNL
jgi:hypothetical protein